MSKRPRTAEFSPGTYNEIIKRGVCEVCGCKKDKNDPWQVHHRIYIVWGIEHGLPH